MQEIYPVAHTNYFYWLSESSQTLILYSISVNNRQKNYFFNPNIHLLYSNGAIYSKFHFVKTQIGRIAASEHMLAHSFDALANRFDNIFCSRVWCKTALKTFLEHVFTCIFQRDLIVENSGASSSWKLRNCRRFLLFLFLMLSFYVHINCILTLCYYYYTMNINKLKFSCLHNRWKNESNYLKTIE